MTVIAMNRLLSIAVIWFSVFISACTSTPNFDPIRRHFIDHYIGEEVLGSTSGRITKKETVSSEDVIIPITRSELKIKLEQIERDYEICTLAERDVANMLGEKISERQIIKKCNERVTEQTGVNNPQGYSYTIVGNRGTAYQAFSFSNELKIGDCVNLFVGKSANRISPCN